jgi:hypothetical protein
MACPILDFATETDCISTLIGRDCKEEQNNNIISI